MVLGSSVFHLDYQFPAFRLGCLGVLHNKTRLDSCLAGFSLHFLYPSPRSWCGSRYQHGKFKTRGFNPGHLANSGNLSNYTRCRREGMSTEILFSGHFFLLLLHRNRLLVSGYDLAHQRKSVYQANISGIVFCRNHF